MGLATLRTWSATRGSLLIAFTKRVRFCDTRYQALARQSKRTAGIASIISYRSGMSACPNEKNIGDVYYRRRMFTDFYACVMDGDHPLAQGQLTLDRYVSARHVAVTHNGRWEGLYISALRAMDLSIGPAVSVSSHDILERLIPGSELIATIPSRLARRLSDKLVLRRFPLDVFIQVDMYWTERTHHSGLHRWVREQLAEVARRNLGDEEPE